MFLSKTDSKKAQVQNKSLTFQEVLRRLELNYNDIKSGLGSTNILFMSLELIALREQEIGAQLTLIEEIEAHLHPQAQLRVIKSFETYLAENPSFNAQYILTTHSPTLASSIKMEKDRKSTRLNSSHVAISYAVFCLKKKMRDER